MKELNSKGKEMYDFVEEYDRKIHRHELQVNNKQANDTLIDDYHSLGKALSYWMSEWRHNRTDDEKMLETLPSVWNWINRAYDYGCIDEADGLIGKLDDCRNELTIKDNELRELSPQYERLKTENERLEWRNRELELENAHLKMKIEEK